MRFGWQWAVLAGALSLAPAATFAASSCYEPSSYPAVLRIEAAEGGFRAYTASPDLEKAMRLALELRKRHGWRPDDPGPAYVHPVIGYSKQNGFVQLGDDLWVATDLGLSNWSRKTSKWKNYAPDPSSRLPMRETSCPDLYRHLIDTLPRSGWNEAMPAKSPYHQLIETLARLRPRAIDAATLADGLFHVFFADGIAFNPEPGERAYRSEDFAAAFQEIKQRAEKGELQAQYNLGTLYALGKGVGRDFAQAATWLGRAAAQGHAQAQANLGLLLLNGARTKAQWREAERWLHKASDQDSNYAKTAFLLMRHSRTPASLSD